MADEITINLTAAFKKAAFDEIVKVSALKDTLTASTPRRYETTKSIPTTAGGTTISIPADIATAGYAFFKNVSASNYVEIGIKDSTTFEPLVKLAPGQIAFFPLTTTAVFALANTAAVDLRITVFTA